MQAAHVDEELLRTLERAFAHHAGADGRIDAEELQRAIGLRSEYLARRVLAAFDRDGDGFIQKDEFLEGVRRLVLGSDREKLAFAFRVHDHDGDGFLSQDELYRMVALALHENEVARRATQPPERLANALFLAADRNRDGRVSFEELEAVVRARPALLAQLTRSEAQWIAPNEDLLAWLDGGRGRASPAWRFLENHAAAISVLSVWIAANFCLLAAAWSWSPATFVPARLGGALGVCVTANGALVLVPVLRRLLGRLRGTWMGRVVPVDDATDFHKLIGHTLFGLGVAHAISHVVAFALGHGRRPLSAVLGTPRGATGAALLLVFTVMWLFALSFVRRSRRFELFSYSHLLYVPWMALAIAHAPRFALFAGVPLVALAAEQIVRFRRRRPAAIVAGHALRSGVTRLVLRRPPGFRFAAGDWIFLRVPAVARREWHPFTISSAPEREDLTVHVRSLGNWTSALRRHVEEKHASGSSGPMEAFVDGPYGSPSALVFRSKVAVLVGAGIGVTPFASILESLVLRVNRGELPGLERAYFFWANRDAYSFEWFAALLRELEREDHAGRLEVHLCMTEGRAGVAALGLEAARALMQAAGRTDVVTGLRTHAHLGPPDWEQMLGEIAARHRDERVDVFFCGPPGLGRKLRPLSERLGLAWHEERF